jgi:lipopolysaccharide export system permease protein
LIISRYLFREILQILLALTVLLVLIYISHRFMMYLVQASVGDLPAAFIFKLLALKLLSDLMLILPLGFFLALLLTLGRLYKDNEITAMAACGIAVPVASIIGFGVIFAVIVGILSLLLAPWAENQMGILEAELNTVAEVSGIAPGRFKEFNQGQGIFYVETIEGDTMQTLFMQARLPHKRIVMVAKEGYQTVEAGELFMVFVEGHRYESKPGSLSYVVTDFAEHRIRIPKRLDALQGNQREAVPTRLLWFAQEAPLQAELQWRLSLPLSVIFLAALAIPLSHTTPRQGQYAKTVVGILIYLIYGNLLNVATKWVERGDVSPWIGVWWVHVSLLLVVLVWFHLPFFKSEARRFFNVTFRCCAGRGLQPRP